MKHRFAVVWVVAALGLVVAVALYGAAGALVLNARHVSDQLIAWNAKPNAAISEQMSRDDMTQEGRLLYLASRPVVDSRAAFDKACEPVTKDTSILGCYIKPSSGLAAGHIVIYHQTDKRLDGSEEVMAAHQMLRAAWDRMSPAERAPLASQLDTVLLTTDSDELDLSHRMTLIKRNDPADSEAELYAIVGTEVDQVNATLEQSYDRFFVKRSIVTKLNAHSLAYLEALKRKTDALVATMTTLGTTIDTRVKHFKANVSQLKSDVSSFNKRAQTPGGFATEAQFDAARAGLISRQHALEKTAKSVNAQIDEFKSDLTKLDALSKTGSSLIKSLNIPLDPLPDSVDV